jgi:hypothetical protein
MSDSPPAAGAPREVLAGDGDPLALSPTGSEDVSAGKSLSLLLFFPFLDDGCWPIEGAWFEGEPG